MNLSLADPVILKQNNFTDHEIIILKNLASEKLQRILNRQRLLKEHTALQLIE